MARDAAETNKLIVNLSEARACLDVIEEFRREERGLLACAKLAGVVAKITRSVVLLQGADNGRQ